MAGDLEYRSPNGSGARAGAAIAVLHDFVPNEGDAYTYTVRALGRFFDSVIGFGDDPRAVAALAATGPGWSRRDAEPPELIHELAGESLDSAELLGIRTAQLHCALASDRTDPAFAPEAINGLYQRGVYQSMRNSTRRALAALRRADLADADRVAAETVADHEDALLGLVRRVMDVGSGMRIRIHGDLHLGQILYTGRDFTFIDFEGEPTRPLSERRIKRTPLRDVAGMLRSFDYATRGALGDLVDRGAVESDAIARERFGPWAAAWARWVSGAYLRGYFTGVRADRPSIIPATDAEIDACLGAHVLDKAMYELQYELAHRPTWVSVPLSGILDIIEAT